MGASRGTADGDVAALRAVAHPLRLQILSLLTGAAMSAAELARELGTTHANASYHLRVLADAGEVVEAGEETIRGGVAKRYRHVWDARTKDPDATPRPEGDLTPDVQAMATELTRRFAGRGHPTGVALCDAELWVDPEVWESVLALTAQASRLIHESARPPHADGAVHVNLTMAAFGMSRPTDPDTHTEPATAAPEETR
ncbi:winged helix-turn-helix transcriptional regulator [Nocardioides sp. KIGAM211]|uniref:Winged helix-turn-helix transcriptional regulator n=1 Tax=Nocardioides luti TaxID=2761101 RepID=A0A7X0REH7_9ACTN|nr:winged helix-turn-helix domain-containing protein [Nocardioides luti]MBB6626811.1 winged helix-turn-helix transcriptional regulator [Nocardioides luti]